MNATKLPSLARAAFLKNERLVALLGVLNATGEARVVGGAVRNTLMKLPVTDVDIATTLRPDRVAAVCRQAGFAVHPTGLDHGTLTVVVQGQPFEVTTLRRDVATDGRHAEVQFTDDWREDAARRDFTMNAMSCDAAGKIYDYSNGYQDILKKKVSFVGVPSRRIREDYLRILRFFRFHARYGGRSMDRDALSACTRLRKGLRQLSAERVRQELFKLLVAPNAVATLKVMAQAKILGEVLPHAEHWRVLARLPDDAVLRLFVLARFPAKLKSALRLANADAARLEALDTVELPTPALRPAERKALLYHMGDETWRDAAALALARSRAPLSDKAWRQLISFPKRWKAPAFPIRGSDLLAQGFRPGPAVGHALLRMERAWIASGFKADPATLLAQDRPFWTMTENNVKED